MAGKPNSLTLSVDKFERDIVYSSECNSSRKVLIIPKTFKDTCEYLFSFYRPLLEEAKTDVTLAYEAVIGNRGSHQVTVDRKWQANGYTYLEIRSFTEPTVCLLEGTVVYLNVRRIIHGQQDVNEYKSSCLGAVITYSDERAKRFELRAINPYVHSEARGVLVSISPDETRPVWITPTCRISSHRRCFDALMSLRNMSPHNLRFLLDPCSVQKSQVQNFLSKQACLGSSILLDGLKSTLNTSQFEALTECVQNARNTNQQVIPPFSLIQGPPGTGKTKVIIRLVNVLHLLQFQTYFEEVTKLIREQFVPATKQSKRKREIHQNINTHSLKPRIMICAPSNAAVDNALERIINDGFLQMDGTNYSPDVIRVVSGDAIISSSAQALSIDKRVKDLIAMTTSDWRTWYSRQYHTVSISEAQLKEKMNESVNVCDVSHISSIVQLYETRDRALGDLARLERLRPLHDDSVERGSSVQLLRQISDDLSLSFMDEAEIVCCTLTSISNRHMLTTTRPFKTVIVDEACQANEVATLIPLVTCQAHCVLVGDPKQLPATVKSKYASDAAFERSLFERLVASGMKVNVLTTQYRMHPQIRMFPSLTFYSNILKDAPRLEERRCLSSHAHWPFRPYMIFDVMNGIEEQTCTFSRCNKAEALFVIDLLTKYSSWLSADRIRSIVILSGYREQCTLIEQLLKTVDTNLISSVVVRTVDAFQGQEADVVIFSCVRTCVDDIGFLADTRRLNVALTRARFSLWIVCKCEAICKFQFWKNLVDDAKERGCYSDAQNVAP